ncbi:MAG: choice-of-anchor Q domain-containing protein [Lysobacteraceae bacterium]
MHRKLHHPCTTLALAAVLTSPVGHAATTRCVSDVAGLDAALKEWVVTAPDADARFVIQMQSGNYALPASSVSEVYQYSSTTPVALELRGGYASACTDRTLDARNTVIDGGGFANARLHLLNVNQDALIEGISFTGLTGGVQIIHRLEAPATGHHFRVSHARIVGNIAADFLTYTMRLWGFGNASGAEVVLDNSLIADNLTSSSTPVLLSTGNNGRIAVNSSSVTGNIASSGASMLSLQHWNAVSGLDIVFDSSIAWNNGSGAFDLDVSNAPIPPRIDFGLIGQLRGALAMGSSYLSEDPQFANPTAGEYRLAPGSPALEAGNPMPADALPDFDLIGSPRVQGVVPDLGPFEGEFSERVFVNGFE